jgi:hypothetical protein
LQHILGQAINSDLAKSNASDIKVDQVLIPIVQMESGAKIIGSPVKTNCSILDEFIGNLEVKRLSDLSNSQDDSTSAVIGWYDSVYEGIDIWCSVSPCCDEPRFL